MQHSSSIRLSGGNSVMTGHTSVRPILNQKDKYIYVSFCGSIIWYGANISQRWYKSDVMKGQLLAECGFELASEYEPAFSELMNVEVVFLA